MNNLFMKILVGAGALLALFSLGAAAPAQAATNLIANPTFTATTTQGAGIVPLGWHSSAWGAAAGAVFSYPVAGQDDGFAARVSLSSYNGVGQGNGAAEWYFDPVAVTPGALYSFSDWYASDAASYLMAQWTLTDGSNAYDAIETLPSTNGAWASAPVQTFTAPSNAVSLTILHLIQSVGSLTVDNYLLSHFDASGANALASPMISLTFDDGYSSQYENALPVLKAANAPATFYIVSDYVTAAQQNLFNVSQVSTSTVTTNAAATWSGLYLDPTNQDYVFSDTYTATATTTVNVRYTVNGAASSTRIGTMPPATNGALSLAFTLPKNTNGNTVSPITISQTLLATGTLTASNPSLTARTDYMNPTQILALQAAGHEIDAHTKTHTDLTTLSLSAATTEVAGSRTALQALGASPVDTLAYPYGNYSAAIENIVQNAGYRGARTVDTGYNGANANPFSLKSYSVISSTTFATAKAWIDAAVANRWWLILTLHDVNSAAVLAAKGEPYGTTPELLQQIIAYATSVNMPIRTMDQGLAALGGTPPPPPPPTPAPIQIITSSLPSGRVGSFYSTKITASTTASGPFSWSVTGTLPPGLTAALASTGKTMAISGTPTAAGTYSFTVSVTNGTSVAKKTYSVSIAKRRR